MYRLKELDIRLPERGHVVKAAEAGLLEQASNIIVDAEQRAKDILVAAQERFQEEERRGYETGEARAVREATARLLREQSMLDAGLAALSSELARLVGDCMRQMIGATARSDLLRDYVTHALRTMRRQKRIRLSVAADQFEHIRQHVERIAIDFPEIELIDVQENSGLDEDCFTLEAESGRIEGSVTASLARMEELLLAAVDSHASHSSAEPASASQSGTTRSEKAKGEDNA